MPPSRKHRRARLVQMLIPLGFAGARPLVEHDVAQAALLRGRGPWAEEQTLRDHWLIYTNRGGSTLHWHEGRASLRAGELWLVAAGADVAWRGGRGRWEGFRLALAPTARWAHLPGTGARPIEAGQAFRMLACLEGIFHEAAGPQFPDHAAMAGYFASAVVLFLDRRLAVVAPRGQSARGADLHDLWGYVAARLGGEWTVPALAQRLGVSAPQLHRLCHAHYRDTPHGILTRMRMEAARGHVLEGRLTLEHIAELTGYADAFALSKAFKRHFGEAPEPFRRRAAAELRGPAPLPPTGS